MPLDQQFVVDRVFRYKTARASPERSNNGALQLAELFKCKIERKKRAHGLNARSALVAPGVREKLRRHGFKTIAQRAPEQSIAALRMANQSKRRGEKKVWAEKHNTVGRCHAQMIWRVQCRAAELGHTPTGAEMKAVGLHPEQLRKAFGTFANALMEAGLTPGTSGNRHGVYPLLPKEFPSKEQLLETRMPWPKDYISIGYEHAMQRRAG